MERLVLAGLLLASLIVQSTRSDTAPAAASADGPPGSAIWMVPPMPPMPPMPPHPPRWHGFAPDIDIDFDHDLAFLERLSLERVVSRELAEGEQATCPTGSVCSFECAGGGCKVDCERGSVCAVSCDGGRCHNTCADGAVCSLECDGDDCTSTCGDGAVCHVSDADGKDRTEHRRQRRLGHRHHKP